MGAAFRILLSLCLCLGPPALADETAKPADAVAKPDAIRPNRTDGGGKTPDAGKQPTSEDRTLEAFGAQNKSCEEWTDTCAVCTRVAAGATACSLPGIACQPATITCRRETSAKPPEKPPETSPDKTPPEKTPPAK